MFNMTEGIVLIVIIVLCLAWIALEFTELVYNRCKRHRLEIENMNLLNALSELAHAHEGWQHNMGRCVCRAHENARAVIRAHHEGGQLGHHR